MGLAPMPSRRRSRSPIGPVMLILLGVLFLLDEVAPHWGLYRTWPVLLVALGLLLLIEWTRPPRPPEGPRI